jgi:CRISPR system Cascade subunit CasC
MTARFLQIHTLTSFPASLLNRDDAGFAKRMPFGGAIRTRVSSQCLKRHWRTYDGENGLKDIAAPESVRSRESFERYIVKPLVVEGTDPALARAAAQKVVGLLLGSEAKQDKADKKGNKKKAEGADAIGGDDGIVKTSQVTVLGRPELDYLCQLARQAVADAGGDRAKIEKAIQDLMKNEKELKKNIQALKPGSLEAGLGAALFGRMVTGDVLARTDAAIHVAHAMTVHGQQTESDYFSAIDDLIREDGEQESGHINASELTSGVFYGYVVIDVNGLLKNLGGEEPEHVASARGLAGDVVQRLVQMVATVSPGAKKGSTAPYAYSHLVLVESGKAQPRTLQNAFVEPVKTSGNVIDNAYQALARHLTDLDAMYGKNEERAHAGLRTDGLFEGAMNLASLAAWAKARVVA